MGTDPNAEQAYAEVLQRGRERSAQIAEELSGTRERVAEQVEQVRAQGTELTERSADTDSDDQHNPWRTRRREPVTLEIGFEDAEPARSAPSSPRAAREPEPAEDDDLSGRSWMR